MCDPVSLGIMVGSKLLQAGLENQAAKRVDEERAQKIMANRHQIDQFRDKASQEYQQSLQKVSKDQNDQDMEQMVAEREAAYQPKISQTDMLPGQGNASDAVKTAVVNALGRGAQKAEGNADRRAAVDAYGDVTLGQNIALSQQGSKIDAQGRNARGVAGILPLELDAASHAGDSLNNLAGMVDLGGTLAGAGYDMYKGSLPGRVAAVKSNVYPGMSFHTAPGSFGPYTPAQQSLLNSMGRF